MNWRILITLFLISLMITCYKVGLKWLYRGYPEAPPLLLLGIILTPISYKLLTGEWAYHSSR